MRAEFERSAIAARELAVIFEVLENARRRPHQKAHQIAAWIGMPLDWRVVDGVGRNDRRQIEKVTLPNHRKPHREGLSRARSKRDGGTVR
jgi:hypothetical protein